MEFNEGMTQCAPLSTRSSFSDDAERVARRSSQFSDTSLSQYTSTPPRRVSIASGPPRKLLRTMSTYISPYRKWKGLIGTTEDKPVEARKATMENTYRTEPTRKLPEKKVQKIIESVLMSALETETYDGNSFGFLARLLSSRILAEVKALNIERYKLVCLVNIGSKQQQGLEIASRSLWDPNFDTVVSATFENGSFFAVASVYGVYFE